MSNRDPRRGHLRRSQRPRTPTLPRSGVSENVSKFKPHPKACKYCGSITRYQADPEGHLKRCAEEQARLLKGLPPTRRRGKRIEVPEL